MLKDDIERVVFTEEELKLKVAELGKKITHDYQNLEGKIFCVGILKGASVFFTDLVREIDLPVQFDFMIASSYGDSTTTSGTVKILKDLDYDIAGSHIIVIEDIIDSGFTMDYLMKFLKQRNPSSVKLCALLNKPEARRVDVTVDYCGYDVGNEFLVGYGLDYAEKYRNLPYIGVLKSEVYA